MSETVLLEKGETQTVVRLPVILDLTQVEPLKRGLVEAVSADCDITFDASDVDRIGTAAIQLLHATTAAAARQGRKITLADPSEAFVKGFEDIGLSSDLVEWSTS